MRNNKFLIFVVAAIICLMVAVEFMGGPATQVSAAPLGAPTPVTYNRSKRDSSIVTWFSAENVAATTRRCVDLRGYDAADIQYAVTGAASNNATINLQYSNDNSHYYSAAAAVATVVSSDTSAFNRFTMYGRYGCIQVVVANATPIAVTVVGVAK